MKTYQGSEIRNVAVVGHAHSGKTTLIAALLHAAKMTPTQGRVEDGSAVTAYDEEEVARGTTMQNAVAFAEWQGVKINFVDTPGFHMFTHEARAALLPVEAAVVVVNAQNGVEAVTERVWQLRRRSQCAPHRRHQPDGPPQGRRRRRPERPDRRPARALGPHLCARPVAHRRRAGISRRRRPRHHGGLLLHARRRWPRQDPGEIPASLAAAGQGRATKPSSNWSPKAKTS